MEFNTHAHLLQEKIHAHLLMEFNTHDHLLQEKIHAIIDAYINGQHGIAHWGEFLKSIGVLENNNIGFTHYTRKYSITDPRAFMMACIQYGF